MQEILDDIAAQVRACELVSKPFSNDPIKTVAARISAAAAEVGAAWSGSAIGYHSRVYYRNLHKPPPGETFSAEWGLMEHSFDEASRNWVEYDFDVVAAEVLSRAGNPDWAVVEAPARDAKRAFKASQSELVAALDAFLALGENPPIRELRDAIRELGDHVPRAHILGEEFGNRQVVTRDMTAMSQGIQVPPHRAVVARMLEAQSFGFQAQELANLASSVVSYLKKSLMLRSSARRASGLEEVELLATRFHRVASQLRVRHASGETLRVETEYDVQDLLHALLKVFFDDVRPEEWTPSYAGKPARMDFLMKPEQIVVETKMTRVGLGQKEIGDELLIDIGRYKAHPDCKTLVCFVYDPMGRIGNARGLEADLSGSASGVAVRVIVAPKV